jgi:outer membrane protein assembly factor BamE (lipoprotein component of BamABCDE complex)
MQMFVGRGMKRKLITILNSAVIAAMLMIALACVLFVFNMHGLRVDRFNRLRVGMTETEVEEMMGEPKVRWKDGTTTFWVYGSRLTFCKAFVTFGDENKMTGTFHDH